MTPDEIVNELKNVYKRWKARYFRKLRERAALKYEEIKVPAYDKDLLGSEETDDAIVDNCIQFYKALSKEDREIVRMVLPQEVSDLLIGYGKTYADICLQNPNQNDFTNGLYAMGMGYETMDIRDVWITLSTLCDVAMRKNLSYDAYFKSEEPFVDVVKEYLKRPDIKDILHVMRRSIVKNKNGVEHYK